MIFSFKSNDFCLKYVKYNSNIQHSHNLIQHKQTDTPERDHNTNTLYGNKNKKSFICFARTQLYSIFTI